MVARLFVFLEMFLEMRRFDCHLPYDFQEQEEEPDPEELFCLQGIRERNYHRVDDCFFEGCGNHVIVINFTHSYKKILVVVGD